MTEQLSNFRRLSVAPMMDWTDRHCRFLHRLIAPKTLLYTEMVHTNAIIFGDANRHLYYKAAEHPIALQLGGSDPESLKKATEIAEIYHYDEINLNCGCPSERVQKGSFGACLMDQPTLVSNCIKAMTQATNKPVTIKTRLGIDHQDSYEFLKRFIDITHENGGCTTYILHARKAWLKGLSPKENREKPPLMWQRVHQIKQEYPHLTIIINGGFETLDTITEQFNHVDGVMIGRKAYHDPFFLHTLEHTIFPETPTITRQDIIKQWLIYLQDEQVNGTPLKHITRHALGLFYHQNHAKSWKNALMLAAKNNHIEPIHEFLESKS